MAITVPAANKAPNAIPVFLAQLASIIKYDGNLHGSIPQRFPEFPGVSEASVPDPSNEDVSELDTLAKSSTQSLKSHGVAWRSAFDPTEPYWHP
jgi:hypothetical protein